MVTDGDSYSRVFKCVKKKFTTTQEFCVIFFKLYICTSYHFFPSLHFRNSGFLPFPDTADLWHFTKVGFTSSFCVMLL